MKVRSRVGQVKVKVKIKYKFKVKVKIGKMSHQGHGHGRGLGNGWIKQSPLIRLGIGMNMMPVDKSQHIFIKY